MTTCDYEQTLKDCIKHNHQVLFKLSELLIAVEHYHEISNTVRTCGTTAGVAGAGLMVGSFLVAPFSDQLSTAVTLLAAGFSVGGAATNLILGSVDRKKSKDIINQIQSLVRSRDSLISKLKEESNHYEIIMKNLMSNGHSEEQAIRIAVNTLANDEFDLKAAAFNYTLNTTVVTLGRVLQVQFDVLKGVGPNLNPGSMPLPTLSESRDLIANGIGRFALFARGMNSFGVLDKDVSNINEETIGFSKLMATAAVITSAVISVIDLAFLIRNWTSAHPTVKVIMDVRRQLEKETKSFEEILSTIEHVRRHSISTPKPNFQTMSSFDRIQNTIEVISLNDDVQTFQRSNSFPHSSPQQTIGPLKKSVKSMSFDEKSQSEPVINNDVLVFQRDIIDMFLQQKIRKPFNQLRKISPSTSIYRAYYQPVAKEIQINIQKRMFVRFTNDLSSTKITDLLYKTLINQIRNSARDQMIHLYENGNPYNSPHTSFLHNADVMMSQAQLFVDKFALDQWLRFHAGDRRVAESTVNEITRIFENLDAQIRFWMNELKGCGY